LHDATAASAAATTDTATERAFHFYSTGVAVCTTLPPPPLLQNMHFISIGLYAAAAGTAPLGNLVIKN